MVSPENSTRLIYSLTEADLFDFQRYHALQRPRAWIGVLSGYAVFYVFVLGIGLVGSALVGAQPIQPDFLLAIVAVLTYAGLFRYLLVASVRQKAQPPGLLGPHTVEISPHGISDASETYYANFKWSGFTRVCGAQRQILLYVGRQALIIPRRAFSSPEAAESSLSAMARWHASATLKPRR